MKSVVTVKLRIPTSKILLDTMREYSKATSYIANAGIKKGIIRRYDLHHLCYYKARAKFNLPSQFIINANRIASQTLKSMKTNKGGKPIFKEFLPLDFDRRTFTFSFGKVRLTTIRGRIDIPIEIPEYYWKYLDWTYQTARIIFDKRKRMFIHIAFSRDINTCTSGNNTIIGVDLGINNLAVCSDGTFFKGHKTRIIQHHYLRKRLQAKGTKSAKRKLIALSGRQKRYMAWVNHNISKQIITKADTIVLEDLKGIRRNMHRRKRLNRWLNNWSYHQLGNFIKYKAGIAGKRVVFVNPSTTSQTCSNCNKIGSRYADSFTCSHCGFSSQSDFNASCNLRRHPVTMPNVSNDDSKAEFGTVDEFRDKISKSP